MSKVMEYIGFFHTLQDALKERWSTYKSSSSCDTNSSEFHFRSKVRERMEKLKRQTIHRIDRTSSIDDDFSHLTRLKTRKELVQISAAVMGIEFSYAAETAFVSPLLLNIGLRHRHMTLIWCLSPLIGFFLTPILGSLSDGCRSKLGRRRPFILLLSIGIILGLLLVPNGKLLGKMFGDTYAEDLPNSTPIHGERMNGNATSPYFGNTNENGNENESVRDLKMTLKHESFYSKYAPAKGNGLQGTEEEGKGLFAKYLKIPGESVNVGESSSGGESSSASSTEENHPWSLIFTILGTVLLDFDADACQSPSRAYMLDVTIPEDHAKGLSTFTVMAGLGGSLGYAMGALNWENTFVGEFFGGQVRAVFTLVLFIFIGCVIVTLRSAREIPLDRLWEKAEKVDVLGVGLGGSGPQYSRFHEEPQRKGYGTTSETSFSDGTLEKSVVASAAAEEVPIPTFKEYVKTILLLPKSLQWLCLTNFFCWMSLVCYSLYFTDFVGEAVFHGDPAAKKGTTEREAYEAGVRFGCWGMSLYSLSCSLYSLCIERLVSRFGAKRVYITGQLVYSVGMVFMAIVRHPGGVILFSWTAGIMYATLFTMPYLLVARYHAAETFDVDVDDLVDKGPGGEGGAGSTVRGLGTDVAIVSSMVFLAQIAQAWTLGTVVSAVGSTTAIICAASLFAACGALAATKVLYLDL